MDIPGSLKRLEVYQDQNGQPRDQTVAERIIEVRSIIIKTADERKTKASRLAVIIAIFDKTSNLFELFSTQCIIRKKSSIAGSFALAILWFCRVANSNRLFQGTGCSATTGLMLLGCRTTDCVLLFLSPL
jgi:F0F1-type ATP synthase membrane subunit a